MITVPSNVLAAVAKWASTDDTRPELNTVLFTNGEYVACDGHRLVRVPLEYDGKPFCVDRSYLLAAVAARRELLRSDYGEIRIEPDDNGHVSIGISPVGTILVPFRDPSRYPPYERVMPQDSGEGHSPDGYTLDPRYLAAIAEITDATCLAGMRGIRVTAWSRDKLGAMAFENSAGVRFVVMPMRM